MTGQRLKCCVPFCTRSRQAGAEPEEWLCQPHYGKAPLKLRMEYSAAWGAAERADLTGNKDPEIFRRVTDAWEKVKDAAMRKALAN